MKMKHPYAFGDLEGFTPHISRLVYMMAYARQTTLQAVQGLEPKDLDVLPAENGNSIGMLLEHMAAVESYYQVHTFENREFTAEEGTRWRAGGGLGSYGRKRIKGHALDYYVKMLAEVRDKTLAELAKRDDAWLHETSPWWKDQPANNYFKWFHVFEDEINHRGQIRIIRKGLI